MKKQVVILILAILLMGSSCQFWESLCNKCPAPESVGITNILSDDLIDNGVILTFTWTPVPQANSYNLRVFSVVNGEITDNVLLQVNNIEATSYVANMNIPVGTVIRAGVSCNCGSSVSSTTFSSDSEVDNGGGTVDIVPYRTMPDFNFSFAGKTCEEEDCTFFKFPPEIIGCGTASLRIDSSLSGLYYRKKDLCQIIRQNRYPDICAAMQDLNNILRACPQYIKYDIKECK